MYALEKVRHGVVEALCAALPAEVSVSETDFSRPPQAEMGDLAYPCFAAAKLAKKSPVEVAKEVAAVLVVHGIAEARAVGPYINFFFDKKAFATAVLEDVLGRAGEYGDAAKKDVKIMVEYGQANTHKEVHVGHLRNLSLGLSVSRLLMASGKTVIQVNYPGDIGAHVAKCLWAYKKFHANDELPADKGRFLGQMYIEASRRIDEDETLKLEVAEVQRKLEAREPEWQALWEETRRWSMDELTALYAELGCVYDRIYFESEVEGPGKELVQDMLAKGIATKGDRDATIVDLENEGLGAFLVLKGDGASLYATKELALAHLKFQEYPDLAESVHVVDNRQSLYFKQFFATLKRLGFDKPMTHLAYDFVTLADGAMSSRKGNVITYEDFRDEMLARVLEETKARHEDWSAEKQRENAWAIAEGAMKFGMLKQDNDKAIVFDMAAALSFDGFTGPYVQYSHARLSSILAKAAGETVSVCVASQDPAEFALLRKVADMPDVLVVAAHTQRPSLMAQYLFELAQEANAFYRDVQVLNAEPGVRNRRLAAVAAAQKALARGLWTLGIRAPEEM